MPVTRPVEGSMDAVAILLLLHVPPDVPSLKVPVKLAQICAGPVMAGTDGLTVTVTMAEQPVPDPIV